MCRISIYFKVFSSRQWIIKKFINEIMSIGSIYSRMLLTHTLPLLDVYFLIHRLVSKKNVIPSVKLSKNIEYDFFFYQSTQKLSRYSLGNFHVTSCLAPNFWKRIPTLTLTCWFVIIFCLMHKRKNTCTKVFCLK